MSIYSGFATRHQQQSYDQLVEDVIFVLQKRLLKFYNNQLADQNKFLDVLVQLHQQLAKMEENKYLEPRTSRSIEDVLRFLLKNVVREGDGKANGGLDGSKVKNRQVKGISNTVSLLPFPNENKNLSHKNSLTKLHEPTSIGKIIKQIGSNSKDQNNQSNASLADSRNTFINQNKFNLSNSHANTNQNSSNKKDLLRNPQQSEDRSIEKQKNYGNQTQIQFKSRFKNHDGVKSGHELIQNYNGSASANRNASTNRAKKQQEKQDRQKQKQRQKQRQRENREKQRQKQKQTRDYLLQYLQKNNKNYLKGYRKRQIKTRGYSKEYSAHY